MYRDRGLNISVCAFVKFKTCKLYELHFPVHGDE